MNVIDLAERKAHARALCLYVLAGMSIVLLGLSFARWNPAFFQGMWIGLTGVATVYIAPIYTRMKNSALSRLLNDETTQEHRKASSVVGLWAGLAAAAAMVVLGNLPGLATASDAARIIFTAAVAATMLHFATLELRAAR